MNPFRLLVQPDLLLLLIYNGIGFAAFYTVLSSLSVLLDEVYGLPETSIGLCFLAVAGGMMLGGIVTGKFLDWDYDRIKKRIISQAEASPEGAATPQDMVREENFPVEEARLRIVPVYLAVYITCCIGYGWAIQQRVHLAVPLLIQFACESSTVSQPPVSETSRQLVIRDQPY